MSVYSIRRQRVSLSLYLPISACTRTCAYMHICLLFVLKSNSGARVSLCAFSIIVRNEGDDLVEVFDISMAHPWAVIERILDVDGVEVLLPTVVSSQHTLSVTIRTDGTAVPPGMHTTNGTVSSSNGEDSFLLNMIVTPASLRIIALPSVVPVVVMRAGDAGHDSSTSFCTIYNVDTLPITWEILNCSVTDLDALTQPMVTFSDCGGQDRWIDLGSQIPLEITFAAPIFVGLYEMEFTVVGTSTGPAQWSLKTSVEVVPNQVVASRSLCSLEGTAVAGDDSSISIQPRDLYGNTINLFGLEFAATCMDTTRGSSTEFRSSFDMIAGTYEIVAAFPRAGPHSIEVTIGDDTVPPMLFTTVSAVTCDAASEPNEAGNQCICIPGMARQGETCSRCSAGFAPRVNRENGCESSALFTGKISTNGLECVYCPAGLRHMRL